MLSTVLLVIAAVLAAAVLGAAVGLWWLRRAMRRPVRVCTAGGGAGCDGCPSAAPRFGPQPLLAAASGGGGGGGTSGGGAGEPEKRGPDRRTFLRGALGLSALGAVGSFGAATVAYLWPDMRGGFGGVLEVGHIDDLLADIDDGDGAFDYTPGRARFVRYDPADDPDGVYAEITAEQQSPVMALYQVCPHLGCAVPFCVSSQWWECPCHASEYNRWGEYQGGPAPRGMDRFHVQIEDDGTVLLDTTEIVQGPSRGQQALIQPREGPACI